MKNIVILLIHIIVIFPSLAQEATSNTNPSNITRQGFGTHAGFDAGLGFVNPKFQTDGSAYSFDDWDTEGMIYTKNNGRFKIQKVNINLYDNTLEALYDENSVFTFDSENLVRVVINNKVFRVFKIDEEFRIFQLIFRGTCSIYKYYDVLYTKARVNPMVSRKTNKYIKKAKYYLYSDSNLVKMKLSKKSVSKLLQSDKISQQSILDYIEKGKLSIKKEADLIKIMKFVHK